MYKMKKGIIIILLSLMVACSSSIVFVKGVENDAEVQLKTTIKIDSLDVKKTRELIKLKDTL